MYITSKTQHNELNAPSNCDLIASDLRKERNTTQRLECKLSIMLIRIGVNM